jgi:hypothetical protein
MVKLEVMIMLRLAIVMGAPRAEIVAAAVRVGAGWPDRSSETCRQDLQLPPG